MDSRTTGLLVISAGIAIMIAGILIFFGGLGWFGRLPGDLRWERGNTRFYFPLTTMLVISIVLSLLLGLIRRL